MEKKKSALLVYTTKHMHQKIFMLSQKLGMVQGSPVSTAKLTSDAIIDYFDLNNQEAWDKIREKINTLSLIEIPRGKHLKQGKNNGTKKK